MNKAVIIVAGGKGLRMGKELPKQFLLLNKRPILMHTIEQFYHYDQATNIILVLPTDQQFYWQTLCLKYKFDVPHNLANGGATRFESVKNGLQSCINKETIVAIHDGVRPFVSQATIARCFEETERSLAVIPVVDVVDSLRQIDHQDNRINKSVDRSAYKQVQTPQLFHFSILQKAYQQPYSTNFTDDASVVEQLGIPITLVEGNKENIKITTPEDLIIGEVLAKRREVQKKR